MKEPSPTSFPGYQCSGEPLSSRWLRKIWRFPGRPPHHPTLFSSSAPSPLPREGVWTVSSTSWIQVVIKIIIIIKKNLKKLEYGGWCAVAVSSYIVTLSPTHTLITLMWVHTQRIPVTLEKIPENGLVMVLVPGKAWQGDLRKEVGGGVYPCAGGWRCEEGR